ncbi:MAG: Ig-like domain-containing protein [Planctomycetaceae bacterium]
MGSSLTVRARAVDTGGNATLSALQTFTVVPDTFAPTIESVDPADGSSRFEGQRFVRIRFSEAIAENSLSANNFRLVGAGPNGTFGDADDVVIAADLQLRDRDRLVQLTMPSPGLLPGAYRLQINQPAVTDRAGNALGQNVRTETFTVVEFDQSAEFLPFGTDVSLRQDDSSFAISPMPFAFDFFGEAVSGQMFVTTNGVIEFGADSIGSDYSNSGLPTQIAKIVMPFWDDIDPRQSGTIGLYDADGVRVITFLDIPYFSNTPEKVSFQVAFFSNGQIQMRYGRMDALQNGNATIGISDGTKIAVPALGRIENAPELEITTTDGLLNQAGLDALTADDENDLLVFTPDGSGQYTIVRNPGRTAVLASALVRLPEESAIDDLFSEANLSVL